MKLLKLKSKMSSNPQTMLLSNFAILIIIGTLLLMMPWAHSGDSIPVLDCFFTSTSAVCVTGLITVDTATAWTIYGKIIILLLIQLGGLGLMTFGAVIFRVTGTKLSYSTSMTLQDTFFQKNLTMEFNTLLKEIIIITAIIESLGAVLMFFLLPPHSTVWERIFSAIFHTISAFCNAGFSVYSDSLILLRNNIPLMMLFMFLIVTGGLGYFVLIEIIHRSSKDKFQVHRIRWSLNSRVVLIVTLILIVTGMLMIFFIGLTPDVDSIGGRFINSLFQSITARTAGFNTVNIGNLAHGSIVILMLLMFIGGSPGSTAGGVKTTTIAVMIAHLKSGLRNQGDVHLLERRIPDTVIRRAVVVIFLALMWNAIGVLVLNITEQPTGESFIGLVFEQISAFATVGLSTGVTPNLSALGKLWVILSMYVGRLGALTVALWFLGDTRTMVKYPKERLMIG